jgi:hypothetical protein
MAENLLSNFGAPTINSIAARRILSNQVLENLYQTKIEGEGEGVTERFSYDVSGAEIRFTHVKPVKALARRLGSAVNGGNFPISANEGETDTFGIRVLDVMDDPIDLAQVSMNMIPVDLLGAYIKSYTDQVALNINALTIAGKYYATYMREAVGGDVNITTYDGTDIQKALLDANSLLDDGAPDMGVSMFPQDDRCLTIQAKYRSTLLSKGILSIGGANYAYDIVKGGTVNPGVAPRKSEDGFIGIFDNVPVHVVSSLVYKVAAGYLGLEEKDLTQVIACLSSGFANVRAVAAVRDVKIIDHPDGQGIRIQPLTRFGFEVVPGYEKGNSLVVEKDYVNPYSSLKANVFTDLDLTKFEVKPEGSRIAIDADSLLSFVSSSGTITATLPTGAKAAVVLDDDGAIDSVAKFATAYKAGASTAKGILTSGTAKALEGLKSKKAAVLIVCADGTCYLTHVK